MSEPQRRRYLMNHPRSRFKSAAVSQTMKAASPQQKAGVAKFLRGLTGPDGTLTAKVTEKVKVENIPPKAVHQIAKTLRSAQAAASGKAENDGYADLTPSQKRTWRKKHGAPLDETDKQAHEDNQQAGGPADTGEPETRTRPDPGPRPKRGKGRDDANDLGYKAGALTMASLGLMVVGGAALVALGVPVTCFTPDLISEVWKGVRPSRDDETLVHNMCEAIRKRLADGVSDKDLEGSLGVDEQANKGKR